MKVTFSKPVEANISTVWLSLAVRYEEEDMPNDYPHRQDDVWTIEVDANCGQILNWPKGVAPREISMKVCDLGTYVLRDESGECVHRIENGYVPSFIPGEDGDYVNFLIDENGVITNWDDACNEDSVQAYFDQIDE